MPATFADYIEVARRAVAVAGVVVITAGIALGAALAVLRLVRREPGVYSQFRQKLGRATLPGLKRTFAAGIIRTVAVTPTLESVAVLGVIVLVRTFLSFS